MDTGQFLVCHFARNTSLISSSLRGSRGGQERARKKARKGSWALGPPFPPFLSLLSFLQALPWAPCQPIKHLMIGLHWEAQVEPRFKTAFMGAFYNNHFCVYLFVFSIRHNRFYTSNDSRIFLSVFRSSLSSHLLFCSLSLRTNRKT